MKRELTYALMVPVGVAVIGLAAMAGPPADELPPGLPPEAVAALKSAGAGGDPKPGDLPKFETVSKDYEKVDTSSEEQKSMYTLWRRDRDAQVLAELPRNYESQLLFIAYTVAGGTSEAGVQTGDVYAKWKRFDKKLALVQPNFTVRTSGDFESQRGHERVFTDRVILQVPIVANGPGGGPVIDMDALLVGQASKFFGFAASGLNPSLNKIEKAKAFPQNVELAFTLPMSGGRFGTLHYSIRSMPESTGYKPRTADERIGYFTTTYRDIGSPGADTPWRRYINRWHLEKRDPKLKLSPPKNPIIFYLEHTTPVRYRRFVRDGVLEWNKAFEKVGILNAIEVYQQDARTGAHMEKDPEDARYNFLLWTNSNMGFAIGPSRVDPRTGQILDADIVMDEGFVTSWVTTWKKILPEQAMEGFGPETYAWLETRPQWDPRVRLAGPAERPQMIAQIQQRRAARIQSGHPHPFGAHPIAAGDATLMGDDRFDGLHRMCQVNGRCMNGLAKSMDLAMFRMDPQTFLELAGEDGDEEHEGDTLDGVPDWFIGPLLKDVIMHEVGHTLGLRHNFKGSSIHSLAEINDEEFKGRPQTASVMEYSPVNINVEDGPTQGDYTMVTIGPYDHWAIEYGYTFETELAPILARVNDPMTPYATDEDTWGPDPLARRFDYGKDPLNYAESQVRLAERLRENLLDRAVEEGESWSKAREAYEITLGRQFGAVSIAANWIGGSYVNRDKKGDPGDRDPIVPVEVDRQRRALELVIENAFRDEAFGLDQALLRKMTVDKWWDDGGFMSIFEDPTYPVHDRIAGMQAAALTMVINPTTLNRVLDSEYAIPADEDALTVPDVLFGVSDAIWSELDATPSRTFTARKPMISSLRRNLQQEHVERLIDLSLPNGGFGAAAKPVSNLSVHYLRQLQGRIDELLEDHGRRIDPYTTAHLAEASVRIEKALDAQYIYNTDDMGGGGRGGMPIFLQPDGR